MRRVIEHELDARMVATTIVLDDLGKDLGALDTETSAQVRAMLFDAIEGVVEAVRAGEARHWAEHIEAATFVADEACDERLERSRDALRAALTSTSLEDVIAAVEKTFATLG